MAAEEQNNSIPNYTIQNLNWWDQLQELNGGAAHQTGFAAWGGGFSAHNTPNYPAYPPDHDYLSLPFQHLSPNIQDGNGWGHTNQHGQNGDNQNRYPSHHTGFTVPNGDMKIQYGDGTDDHQKSSVPLPQEQNQIPQYTHNGKLSLEIYQQSPAFTYL